LASINGTAVGSENVSRVGAGVAGGGGAGARGRAVGEAGAAGVALGDGLALGAAGVGLGWGCGVGRPEQALKPSARTSSRRIVKQTWLFMANLRAKCLFTVKTGDPTPQGHR